MSNIGKDKMVFDPSAALNDNDLVGSYTLAADGTKITKTTVSGKDGLDVNVINASLDVTATNLDIRDLVFASDKVDVSGSTIALDSSTLAALESITVQNGAGAAAVNIQDGGNSITVDGTVAATQSGTWTIDSITNAVTVQATNLDIRDLAFATDKVDVSGSSMKLQDGSGNAITSSSGSLNVAVTSGTINATLNPSYAYLDGAAHNAGTDDGAYILALDPSGNYAGMHVDGSGNLKVTGTFSQAMPSTSAYSAISVGTSAVALPASPLANRKKIMLQNLGSKPLYIGTDNSVTAANGIRIAAGANVELEWGPSISIYGISTASGQDVRVLEVG